MNNDQFIMSPKVDFAFKEIMMNPKVRKGFLSAVLDIPVESIRETVLQNTLLPKEHEDEKQSILDVYLVMNDDTEINIEIQLAYMSSWSDRSAFYVSKMLVGQIGVNKKYSNLRKCIGITAIPLEIKTSSLIKIFHSCVVVLDGRQPACVLRLAVKNFYSAPFISISSGIAVICWTSTILRKHNDFIQHTISAKILSISVTPILWNGILWNCQSFRR